VLKCIALTYDDGPDPTTTPQLLDVLGRENVTATMFLIGKNAQAHPELVIRERDLGLQIGNHTMTHPTLSKQPAEVVTDELTQTQTVLSTITGVTPTVMRPPYAARNATTDEISGQLGLAVVTWDSSPVDWENKDDRAGCLARGDHPDARHPPVDGGRRRTDHRGPQGAGLHVRHGLAAAGCHDARPALPLTLTG
jgi:peptidoglycan/xylan/chitin deacetylase (PgdA/CDA1 family)